MQTRSLQQLAAAKAGSQLFANDQVAEDFWPIQLYLILKESGIGKSFGNNRKTAVYDEDDIRQAFATLRQSKEKIHNESARRILEADVDSAYRYRMEILFEEIMSLIEEAETEVLYPGYKSQLEFENTTYELLQLILCRQAEVSGFKRAEFIADAALETVGMVFE